MSAELFFLAQAGGSAGEAVSALPELAFNPDLIYVFGLLAVLPFLLVSTTSFVKLAVVFALLRNAPRHSANPAQYRPLWLGSGLVALHYGGLRGWSFGTRGKPPKNAAMIFFTALPELAAPIANFMERNTEPEHLAFFEESIAQVWGEELDADPRLLAHLALMPAFAVTELTEAFEIGFLFYLPFIAVDLITANILLSLGMMMLSPVTISLPFKLFLFVAASGWERLIQALVLGYAP